MTVSQRASKEVAEYFCKKFGCPRAGDIISARLSADSAPDKTAFWQDVLSHLADLQKNSALCGSEADTTCDKPEVINPSSCNNNDALR